MVDFIVLETHGKLRVVMLVMHNINKYMSSIQVIQLILIWLILHYCWDFDFILWPYGEFFSVSLSLMLKHTKNSHVKQNLVHTLTKFKNMDKWLLKNSSVLSHQLKWIGFLDPESTSMFVGTRCHKMFWHPWFTRCMFALVHFYTIHVLISAQY
jgi:hypothetical protein